MDTTDRPFVIIFSLTKVSAFPLCVRSLASAFLPNETCRGAVPSAAPSPLQSGQHTAAGARSALVWDSKIRQRAGSLDLRDRHAFGTDAGGCRVRVPALQPARASCVTKGKTTSEIRCSTKAKMVAAGEKGQRNETTTTAFKHLRPAVVT